VTDDIAKSTGILRSATTLYCFCVCVTIVMKSAYRCYSAVSLELSVRSIENIFRVVQVI